MDTQYYSGPRAGTAGDPLTGPGNAAGWPVLPAPAQTPHSLGRQARYAQYRAYYDGEQWEQLPAPGERRLTFNYARVFVNKAASYLFGERVGYDARPLGRVRSSGARKQQGARDVEDFLQEARLFNNLDDLDLATAITAGMLGDGAYTVRWDPGAGLPRVTGVQPDALDCRWRADDLTSLLWLQQRYWLSAAELSDAQRARLVAGAAAAGPMDPYAPMQACEEWTPAAWRLTVAGVVVDGGANPYGEIPYIVFPNLRVPGEFWGESDLVDLLKLQRELNTRMSIFSRILEVAGNPVAVVTGADSEDTDSLKLGPNQLWTLPEGAKAEVLDLLKAGGADAHLKYIDLIYRTMHDISEMPRTSFGDSTGQSTARSGVALGDRAAAAAAQARAQAGDPRARAGAARPADATDGAVPRAEAAAGGRVDDLAAHPAAGPRGARRPGGHAGGRGHSLAHAGHDRVE